MPAWKLQHRLLEVSLAGALLVLAGLLVATAKASGTPPPPTIALTSPAQGATVKGVVTITATANAGSGDTPTSVAFYDGVNHIGEDYDCENQDPCMASIKWEATGLSGTHSLTARVETNEGLSSTSAPVQVIVTSPPPTVSITAPAGGATTTGFGLNRRPQPHRQNSATIDRKRS